MKRKDPSEDITKHNCLTNSEYLAYKRNNFWKQVENKNRMKSKTKVEDAEPRDVDMSKAQTLGMEYNTILLYE